MGPASRLTQPQPAPNRTLLTDALLFFSLLLSSLLFSRFSELPTAHPVHRSDVMNAQRQIAMISEMIHTASLVHDDVIDQSFARRGKPSVNVLWNHKKVSIFSHPVSIPFSEFLSATLKQKQIRRD